MKKHLLFFTFLTQAVIGQSTLPKENIISNREKQTALYVLKYYYPEEPAKIIFTRVYKRIINKDGSFCLTDYDPVERNKLIDHSCFDKDGIPTEFGNGKEATKIYRDSVRLNFRGKDTTLVINTVKQLKDPTTLWFWKHMPKVNETVTVGGLRKNFITKTIDLVNVEYTYLGKESIDVLGHSNTCYLVKSTPLNGSKGVYDERWFDKQGMIVKEKHVVGKDGFRMAELTEVINK